jgi:hypothetical protein
MQDEDGLNDRGDAAWAAAQPNQGLPGLEGGDGAFAECADAGVEWLTAFWRRDSRGGCRWRLKSRPMCGVDTPPSPPGLLIIADKGYMSAELDRWLAERGVRLLRPSYRNRIPRPDEHLLKPIRQLIESVNDTLKGQLDLELHGRPQHQRRRHPL